MRELTNRQLAEIDRCLDELIMPSYEAVRALATEVRTLRADNNRLANALVAISTVVEQARKGTT